MTKHAIERARERYGLDLDERDIARMTEMVREGRSLLLRIGAADCEIRALVYKDREIVVAYHWRTASIVTLLPLAAMHQSANARRAAPNGPAPRTKKNRRPAERRKSNRRYDEEFA